MTAVAILSTYRPYEGFGGPARILHERRVLEQAGHDVLHVVIEANPSKPPVRSVDSTHIVERPFRAPLDHIYEDVEVGRRAADDARVVRSTIGHLERHDVSCIVMEQPFLVQVAEQLADGLSARVVYSSQNIEFRLRRDLERFQPDWKRPIDRAETVRELEQRAVALADHVTAICPSDQEALRREFGCESTLVPNGSSIADFASLGADARTSSTPVDFVYAGSSYWPNVDGFAEIATPSLAFLPPTARVHVAGSVGPALLEHGQIKRHLSLNRSRLEILGFLSMTDLMSVFSRARSVLVPVFVGEGSNLKSADALAAGVPVIMTRRATHGYEDVLAIDPSGVTVVDSAEEFRKAMIDTLERPPRPGAVGAERVTMLGWNSRLAPLVDVVASAIAAR